MSAPLIWIVFPVMMAGVMYLIRRWERLTLAIGIGITLLLALLAWLLPVGDPIPLGAVFGNRSFLVADTLSLLGRRFIVGNTARPALIFVYLGTAFWFGGASQTNAGRLFPPFGLVIAASLIAALSVEPFLYAAIMIEIAALACVPILAPPGKPVPTGVTRFLTFMTLGMAVILLSGWMLELVEANPADAGLLLRTSVVIALGLMFFMAIFPFHTWIPMVSDESPPYTSAYVFFVLLAITSVLALSFLVRFPWMRSAFFVFSTLRFLGALMVLMGGIWAAFQRHLGRMFGYAVVYEIGLTLLALSLGERGFNLAIKTSAGPAPFNATAVEIFFALLLPRGLSLALWAVALTVLRARFGGLTFRQVQGAARQLPIASASLVLAHLSLAGFPLLAAFPVRVALWTGLAERNLAVVGIVLFGTAGLMAGALRTLAVLVMGATEEGWQVHETWGQMLLMGIATVMLFVIGFLPQYFLPSISSLALLMSP